MKFLLKNQAHLGFFVLRFFIVIFCPVGWLPFIKTFVEVDSLISPRIAHSYFKGNGWPWRFFRPWRPNFGSNETKSIWSCNHKVGPPFMVCTAPSSPKGAVSDYLNIQNKRFPELFISHILNNLNGLSVEFNKKMSNLHRLLTIFSNRSLIFVKTVNNWA